LGFFDDLRAHDTFRLEAEEFANRLCRALPVSPSMRVLDFGCGFGFVAGALAPMVREVVLWDGSRRMRQRATSVLATVSNAHVVEQLPAGKGTFDLIIVNSVVQYVPARQLREWLRLWARLLAPGGRLVVADMLPPDARTHRDLVDQLVFSIRKGILISSLRRGLQELRRYWNSRHVSPLSRFGPDELEAMASEAGLHVEFLPESLTCRTLRLSALFRPATDGGV
jgi:ubiquinone/menaquinone biosynthesis C-methylase UbiE